MLVVSKTFYTPAGPWMRGRGGEQGRGEEDIFIRKLSHEPKLALAGKVKERAKESFATFPFSTFSANQYFPSFSISLFLLLCLIILNKPSNFPLKRFNSSPFYLLQILNIAHLWNLLLLLLCYTPSSTCWSVDLRKKSLLNVVFVILYGEHPHKKDQNIWV